MLLLLLSRFSRAQLCATQERAAHQAPPSLGFSRQEHWSGLPFPSPMRESEKWKWSRSGNCKWSRFLNPKQCNWSIFVNVPLGKSNMLFLINVLLTLWFYTAHGQGKLKQIWTLSPPPKYNYLLSFVYFWLNKRVKIVCTVR